MIDIRHSDERGRGYHGWLDSRHSFSFAGYYDPRHLGHSALRVINDDRVAPGAGFDAHGHRDMEIISLVLEGALEHRDSAGNVQRLPAGEFQLMSAGSGIRHSEYNASKREPVRFLQIWIEPDRAGGEPGYQQKRFDTVPGLTLVASPDGADGSLRIRQDARLYQLRLDPGQSLSRGLETGRRQYLHLIDGELRLNGCELLAGDGARLQDLTQLEFQAGDRPVQALLFDLP
ncbi:MAG: pirin family protein [Oceanospirillaceae bacterium]|nr:pirin family protein [Oceanospirillaceae bacterium]